MTNNQKRWLLFIIAIPLLTVVVLLRFAHHLPINLLVFTATFIGTSEMCTMIRKAGIRLPYRTLPPVSVLFPLFTYLIVTGLLPPWSLSLLIFLTVALILTIPLFTMKENNFKDIITTAGGSILALLYPGYFLTYIVRFSGFQYSNHIILIFILTVYMNDSNAWFVGSLFGRNSRKVFAVSPNKSMAGFAGGIFASLVVTITSGILYPKVFTGPLYIMILLGLFAGVTTILGDLIESGLKRSSGVKDSGSIIMGRGGLLDSIDSLLITAPVFYYFLSMTVL